MALIAAEPEAKSSTLSDPDTKRWTRDEHQRLGELNFFTEQRLELIDGDIVVMVPQKDVHAAIAGMVRRKLSKIFPDDEFWIREQGPLGFGERSEPEPDLSVVTGQPQDIIGRGHPSVAPLIVEISLTTLSFDRTHKSKLYATNNIADYWIVNFVEQQLEFHREPDPTMGVYNDVHILKRDDLISPLAANKALIAVADLLP